VAQDLDTRGKATLRHHDGDYTRGQGLEARGWGREAGDWGLGIGEP
jgi:hypothetical protein